MANTDWIKIIHVAKKETNIDDEAYRAILSGVGVESSTEIAFVDQFSAVMDAFKRLGFRYRELTRTGKGQKRKATVEGNPDFITKRQEYYIKGLWSLASRSKDEKSLKALIKRIGHVDEIRFLPRKSASAVIQALRDICWKAGYNPDQRGAS